MGCDIHAAVECSSYFGGQKWEGVARLPAERNYAFFGAMNGVRRPTSEPLEFWNRGLPAGMSSIAKKWVNGDHSETWCTLKELRENSDKIREHIRSEYPHLSGMESCLDDWLRIGEMMDRAHAWYEGDSDGTLTRFVFNFDS